MSLWVDSLSLHNYEQYFNPNILVYSHTFSNKRTATDLLNVQLVIVK